MIDHIASTFCHSVCAEIFAENKSRHLSCAHVEFPPCPVTLMASAPAAVLKQSSSPFLHFAKLCTFPIFNFRQTLPNFTMKTTMTTMTASTLFSPNRPGPPNTNVETPPNYEAITDDADGHPNEISPNTKDDELNHTPTKDDAVVEKIDEDDAKTDGKPEAVTRKDGEEDTKTDGKPEAVTRKDGEDEDVSTKDSEEDAKTDGTKGDEEDAETDGTKGDEDDEEDAKTDGTKDDVKTDGTKDDEDDAKTDGMPVLDTRLTRSRVARAARARVADEVEVELPCFKGKSGSHHVLPLGESGPPTLWYDFDLRELADSGGLLPDMDKANTGKGLPLKQYVISFRTKEDADTVAGTLAGSVKDVLNKDGPKPKKQKTTRSPSQESGPSPIKLSVQQRQQKQPSPDARTLEKTRLMCPLTGQVMMLKVYDEEAERKGLDASEFSRTMAERAASCVMHHDKFTLFGGDGGWGPVERSEIIEAFIAFLKPKKSGTGGTQMITDTVVASLNKKTI